MPLITGKKAKTRRGFQENIRREIHAGKPQKQAVAIAYKEAGEDKESINTAYADIENPQGSESHRKEDINGFVEIKDNPLSKVGVFPYLGEQISSELEPKKIYKVYRPEEELSNQDTIDSFKLLPWTDEHAMLGSGETGLIAAEKKGVHGVIGENVYFQDGYLKGNIKIFSEKLSNLIDLGKKELSIGYRCLYELVSGVYNGEKYDAIQRTIRGNHLALVDEGRSGPNVAVLDHFKFVFDARSFMMAGLETEIGKDEGEMTLESLATRLGELERAISKLAGKNKDEMEDPMNTEPNLDEKIEEEETKEEMDSDEEKPESGEMKKPEDEEYCKGEKGKGMDSQIRDLKKQLDTMAKTFDAKSILAEMSQRNDLANKLSKHIGTFDHADKTLQEVASYGVKKLGIACREGSELDVLSGYFAAKKTSPMSAGLDSKVSTKSSYIDKFYNNEG